jgi:hypothetical protein
MRVYWERIGVLGPIYRLVGQGFNDWEIAGKLNITEIKVRGCISWMLTSFGMSDRLDLVRHAFSVEHPKVSRAGELARAPLTISADETGIVDSGTAIEIPQLQGT